MEYLHNDRERFKDAINIVSNQTGVITQAIEKDYYVTLILRELAERLPFIVFKGGTSLSKCHKVIKRFSEDIDITIDTTISQGQKKKVKENIVEIAKKLGLRILNLENTRSRRDYNKYELAYETVLPLATFELAPIVLMETSYIAVSFPTVLLPVSNYIGEMMEVEAPEYVKVYQLDPFEMKVQDLNRTLADKVFAICDYYLDGKVRKHSRHLYDIYKLLPKVQQDESFRKLVGEVRTVRAKSPVCPSAQSEVNVPELLNQIIAESAYKDDYEELTEKLLEEDVSYDESISAL